MNNSVSGLISSSVERISDSGSDSARLDAELLLAHVLDRNRTWLFTWPEFKPSTEQSQEFEELLLQRIAGKPIAYILGRREFWGLDFQCNEHTLIPRPETELLVETALSLGLSADASVLDLGTGTGANALALASERPGWNIVAVDAFSDAIKLAKGNASGLGITSVEWQLGSWFEPLSKNQTFDLIISNPPYVEESSPWLSKGDVRFEPRSALVAGQDGMEDIRRIIEGAPFHLKADGTLLLEHGYEQGELVRSAFSAVSSSSSFSPARTLQDLAGLDRATLAKLKAP